MYNCLGTFKRKDRQLSSVCSAMEDLNARKQS